MSKHAPRGAARPSDFASRVLSIVRNIPPGRVCTYGDVAAMAGRPRASRAVGSLMRRCTRPDVPCHRVIAAGGVLGGFGGSPGLKRSLLMAEGVMVVGVRVRELDRVRWWSRSATGTLSRFATPKARHVQDFVRRKRG